MKRSKLSFSVLSLPELVLMAVVKCLNQEDRWSLASSCRALAIAVSAALQNIRVTVTPKTRWKGLCKVLTTNTITVKTLSIEGQVDNDSPAEDNALDVLMNSSVDCVSDCSFQGIEKLCIHKVIPIPCLLPPNLVRVLPSLKALRFVCDSEQFANPQPIPYCSSLCKLEYMRWSGEMQLPNKYHTAEDLRQQLPNIASLVIHIARNTSNSIVASPNCNVTMLQALGDQLSELELYNIDADAKLQQCTRLQSLKWDPPCYSELPLNFLPQSLPNFKLMFRLAESDLQAILQLPLLTVVEFHILMESLQQDWSNHPCTWQQLTIYSMKMVELPKLPLHSLKGQGCLQIERLELPDPLVPTSLPDVTRAAQCVLNVGIIINGCRDMHCDLWSSAPVHTKQDIAMVDLAHAAMNAVKPFEQFSPDNYYLLNYPQTTTAVIRWACQSLSCAVLRINYEAEPLPWLWAALQCCSNLETVKFYIWEDVCNCFDHLSTHIQLAAEHYVTVTGRQLTITIHFFSNPSSTENIQATLQLKLQQLPSTLKLKDFTLETESKLYNVESKLTVRIQPN